MLNENGCANDYGGSQYDSYKEFDGFIVLVGERTAPRKERTRMQVILVGPLPPPDSGPEVVTETLLQSGAPLIHFRHVKLSSWPNQPKKSWHHDPRLQMVKQLMQVAWTLWTQRKDSKIVHLPLSDSTETILRDVALIRLATFLHYRTVVQFHGREFLRFYWSSPHRSRILPALESLDMLLVSDKSMIKQFPFVNESKIRIMVNPVPASWMVAWPSLSRLDPVKDSQPLVILYICYHSMVNSLVELLKALHLLETKKEWELHFARPHGDSEYHFGRNTIDLGSGWDQVQNMIRKYHWEERVHYHDLVTEEDKVALFAQSHVLVVPSYWEAIPLVILEAMYAGLAVIAGRGGAAESLISPALLYDPGRVEQLTQRLWQLSPHRARLIGQNNRRITERGYLPQQVIPLLLRAYETLEPAMRTPVSQKLRVIRPRKKTKLSANSKKKP